MTLPPERRRVGEGAVVVGDSIWDMLAAGGTMPRFGRRSFERRLQAGAFRVYEVRLICCTLSSKSEDGAEDGTWWAVPSSKESAFAVLVSGLQILVSWLEDRKISDSHKVYYGIFLGDVSLHTPKAISGHK